MTLVLNPRYHNSLLKLLKFPSGMLATNNISGGNSEYVRSHGKGESVIILTTDSLKNYLINF